VDAAERRSPPALGGHFFDIDSNSDGTIDERWCGDYDEIIRWVCGDITAFLANFTNKRGGSSSCRATTPAEAFAGRLPRWSSTSTTPLIATSTGRDRARSGLG